MIRGAPTARIVLIVLACALVGVSIFGILVSRAVTIESADANEMARRFLAARATLPSTAALVDIDDAGRVVRMRPVTPHAPTAVTRLKALAWRAAERRLISADAAFWFVKLKGPAARYALHGTGVDLDRLHLTPGDLERLGPGVIVDHTSRDGSRLLVWTE